MKVGIVGYGHVGQTMHKIFKDALFYDKYTFEGNTKEEINACNLAIICVPTPMKEDGSCDTSIVEECVSWLETPLILIKSAVIPGTTDYLKEKYNKRICISPEYFGESKYWLPEEWNNPLVWPFLIVGGDPRDTEEIVSIFTPILGPTKVYSQVDAKTAELSKYMENTWLAMRVTFAWEFYHIAKTLGVGFYKLRECWALDPRVTRLKSTIFIDNPGFGGKCLPKDLSAIIQFSKKAGYEPELLEEIKRSNKKFKGGGANEKI